MNQIEIYVTDLLVTLGIEGFPLEEGTRRLLGAFGDSVELFEWPGLIGGLLHVVNGERARAFIEPGKWILIPHEIGHFRFDSGQVGTLHFREHTAVGMSERRNEGRARRFALAFLMPWQLIHQMTAPELAEAAGVPLEWAEERLRQVMGMFEAV